jgi:hypothetical protein
MNPLRGLIPSVGINPLKVIDPRYLTFNMSDETESQVSQQVSVLFRSFRVNMPTRLKINVSPRSTSLYRLEAIIDPRTGKHNTAHPHHV